LQIQKAQRSEYQVCQKYVGDKSLISGLWMLRTLDKRARGLESAAPAPAAAERVADPFLEIGAIKNGYQGEVLEA
jgi:hypothetical protein